MTFEPRNPDYERRVRDSFAEQRAMATLGAELARVEAGVVEIELAYRTDLTQQHGFLHAGIAATICDSACGYAAFTLMPAEASVLSVEFKINLMAPARGERFVARGVVIRPGRTLTVTEGTVTAWRGADATPVARMQATMMALIGRDGVREP